MTQHSMTQHSTTTAQHSLVDKESAVSCGRQQVHRVVLEAACKMLFNSAGRSTARHSATPLQWGGQILGVGCRHFQTKVVMVVGASMVLLHQSVLVSSGVGGTLLGAVKLWYSSG